MKRIAWLLALVVSVSSTLAMGNEASVWRCGNLYTNQPQPDQSCVSVTISALEETQVPQPSKPASAFATSIPASAGKPPAPGLEAVAQRERDGHAKGILSHELKRLNERCQAATGTQTVQRCAADQAALKRELSRLP
jgi:hypothetical protein